MSKSTISTFQLFVGQAKDIIAKRSVRISARTWDKAIRARIAHLQNNN